MPGRAGRIGGLVATLLLESEPPSSYLPLQLTGELIDGTPFVAYDCIRVQ